MPSEFDVIAGLLCGAGLLFYAALSLATGKIHQAIQRDRKKEPGNFWFAWSLYVGIGASLLAYSVWGLYLAFMH